MKAVIFDLDGTLIDSELWYFERDRDFFAAHGIPWDWETNLRAMGVSAADSLVLVDELHPGNALASLPMAERLRLREEALFAPCCGTPRAFPSTVGLARELKSRRIPVAVASSSSPAIIGRWLAVAGLGTVFDAVVSASEVPRGKPAPDVFLEAARRLGVAPADCLVFEDVPAGLAAALSAGMRCVALPAPGTAFAVFARADRVVEGGPASATAAGLLALARELGLVLA